MTEVKNERGPATTFKVRLLPVKPGTWEQVHQSRLCVTDSFTEVLFWHKVYIWTFKSRYANRCLFSNSITKPDLTWVRKILFPSFFIFHLEIAFHCRRQPRGLWLERNVRRWKWRVLSVRGERMHFRWALLPAWDHGMLMKPAIVFLSWFPGLFPHKSWHTVNLLFSFLILCACVWHLGKSCSQELGE